MRFATFESDDVQLNYAACGGTGHPLVICLHGFPEYWAAWSAVMLELADAYHLVAPDQRGFNLSFRPRDVGAYQTRHIVRDLALFADHLSPDRPFILAGHDWGASIAYAYEDTPEGGRVRISTADAEARAAVHAFLQYQIREHATGDPQSVKR